MTKPINSYFTIKEFASHLGVHHHTIRRAIKSGRIQAFRVGAGKKSPYRIPHSEVERISLFDLEEIIERIIEKRKKLGINDDN